MRLALANPGLFWTGVGLVSVPILIHFFFKRKHRVVRWAAMDFLLAALRKQKRRIEIENLILLLLRCAVIFLIALAIARPDVQAASVNPFGLGARAVVLMVDTSASMGAVHTGRRALDRARERAEALLADLPSESKVTVLATRDESYGGGPRMILENATPDEALVRLATLRLGYGANRLGDVFREAGRRLAGLRGRRMVVFITDLQKSDWLATPTDAASKGDTAQARREDIHRALGSLPRDDEGKPAPVVILDVGQQEQANVVVSDVGIERGRVAFADDLLSVTASVTNYGKKPADGTATLYMMAPGGTRWEKKSAAEVEVAQAGGGLSRAPSKQVTFHEYLPPRTEGPVRFKVGFEARGGADRLPGDSERFLALRVRPPIRILPVQTYTRALDILRDVEFLEVISFEESISPISLSKRDLTRVDIVLWADADAHELDEEGARRLEEFVQRGGALIAYVGQYAHPGPINRLLFRERGEGLFPMMLADRRWWNEENPVRMSMRDRTRTGILFRETVKEEFFRSPDVFGYWPVVELAESADVPARYGAKDGDPAVVTHKLGRGRVIVVTTTPDERWMRLNGTLLPTVFFFNAVHWLVHEDPRLQNIAVGQKASVPLLPNARSVSIEPPEDAGGRTEEPVDDTTRFFEFEDTSHPGFYRFTVKATAASGASARPVEEAHLVAVNREPAEGDLRRVETEQLEKQYRPHRLHFTAEVDKVVPSASGGDEDEMSRALLAGVAGLLFLELFLAWRFGKRRRATA